MFVQHFNKPKTHSGVSGQGTEENIWAQVRLNNNRQKKMLQLCAAL
jgi:hypothetical protein